MVVLNANDKEKTLDTTLFSTSQEIYQREGCHNGPGMAIDFDPKNFAMDSDDYGVGMKNTRATGSSMLVNLKARRWSIDGYF